MKELEVLKELNVLYIDDDKSACESLKHILKYYFNKIFIAHNGIEALKIHENEICHLLIVDYDMPIMDGKEFLSKLRKRNDNTPAFIISSYDDQDKLKKAIPLGLIDYLVKPYEIDELKNILLEFIRLLEKNALLKYRINKNSYYHMARKIVFKDQEEIQLTSYEIKIFEYLLKNKSSVIRYDELLNIIDSENHKSLISMVHKINKKISFKLIKNIKDIGYKIDI